MKETLLFFATKEKTHLIHKDGLWSVESAKRWTDRQGWIGRGKVEHWVSKAGDDTAKKIAVYQF